MFKYGNNDGCDDGDGDGDDGDSLEMSQYHNTFETHLEPAMLLRNNNDNINGKEISEKFFR